MKNTLIYLSCSLFLLCSTGLLAQKSITLEDLWQKGTYNANYVPGFNFQNDGKHYTLIDNGQVKQFDLTTGRQSKVLFDGTALKNDDFDGAFQGFSFSSDESKMLIKTKTEQIYRRSSKANFYIYDVEKKSIKSLSKEGKQQYATFSPNTEKVAFVRQNNLMIADVKTGKELAVTNDGKHNYIINGSTDWVYEEEFAFAKAFEWSPDGKKVAFLRFDESRVKEFTMTLFNAGLYPEYETFKYPKVGEKNSIVSLHIYDLETGKTMKVDTGSETDIYLPRIKWTKDPKILFVMRMNRHQSELDFLLVDSETGKTKMAFQEKNAAYIAESHLDHLTFLDDGKHFIWTSEQDGWSHIYLYDLSGKLVKQLTKGEFDVTNFYGVDEKRQKVYFQSAEASPLEKNIYEVGLDGTDKKIITPNKGSNSAQFSSTFDYFVNTYSSVNVPATYTVYDNSGKAIRTIEENTDLKSVQEKYGVTDVEFFSFKNSANVSLNGWKILPPNFDKNKQYPVLMYVYGGPGSQTVNNSFMGRNYWWFQMLAQEGYIVASVDNRGTGSRGEAFKKCTYKKLGELETVDQIDAAKHLGSLDYVDASRIGIFGWSYGGYMSSLCILKGNEVFKAAIAVAPVTSWRWYDTIYTERFMQTEEENPAGYQENSPVYFADLLKGNYLLVHGNADDNVHFQHSAEMANALIGANKQFDTYFYPNRNHGIYGNNARIHLYTKMTNFLKEKL